MDDLGDLRKILENAPEGSIKSLTIVGHAHKQPASLLLTSTQNEAWESNRLAAKFGAHGKKIEFVGVDESFKGMANRFHPGAAITLASCGYNKKPGDIDLITALVKRVSELTNTTAKTWDTKVELDGSKPMVSPKFKDSQGKPDDARNERWYLDQRDSRDPPGVYEPNIVSKPGKKVEVTTMDSIYYD